MENTFFIPELSSASVLAVKDLSREFGEKFKAIVPSSLDGLDPTLLGQLQQTADCVSTFSTTPAEMEEKLHEIALRVALHFELGKVAIPVHYQNIRDLLRREYGLDELRDSQVRQLLNKSEQISEVRSDIFKSKIRYKGKNPRDTIKHWFSLIDAHISGNVYDLPSFCRSIIQWLLKVEDDPIQSTFTTPSSLFVQINTKEWTRIVYSYESRLIGKSLYGPNREYFSDAAITDMVGDWLTPLDADILQQLEKASSIRQIFLSIPVGNTAIKSLKEYADLWMEYIHNQTLRGQEQKWRGWYLVPEHGPLTTQKLWELQRILRKIHELSSEGSLLIDTSKNGIANVLSLLNAGEVRYQQDYPQAKKRALFIRQQKNYLFRLGLITEPASSYIAITEIGKSWLTIKTKQELVQAFKSIMEDIRWTWCNMAYFRFAKSVAQECEGYITYQELFNWLVHAYDQSQLQEMISAIRLYRGLLSYQRNALNEGIEKKLKSLLDRYMSSAAFGHYRTKIRDLMEAFATTGDFCLKSECDSVRLVLTLQGKAS